MGSVKFDCQYFCGDEDCDKCSKRGGIFFGGCEDCEDYTNFFGYQPNKRKKE